MSNQDRWATTWKIHQDPDGILAGVENLEFSLKPVAAEGLVAYEMISTSIGTNPFEATVFVEFGSAFPHAPQDKLDPWTLDEESEYLKLIQETFLASSTDVRRLHGEKTVDRIKEFLTLLLIPEATNVGNADPSRGDLVVMLCATKNRNPSGRSEHSSGLIKGMWQDGTAHGNPK